MILIQEDLTWEEFKKFSTYIYDKTGIHMKEAKNAMLSNRLRKRLKALNISSYSDYYDYLHQLKGYEFESELSIFFDIVSTHETSFFRHEHNFTALMEVCLPSIAADKKIPSLRIWSAACSTGEEPYTIAICLLERISLFKNWHIQILATDISESVLQTARAGIYPQGRRIEKVPQYLLDKYFIEKGNMYEVKSNVKSLVSFARLNFFADVFPKDLDIIFCRNVMIYFDKEHQKRLVKELSKSINHPGFLFVGYAETLNSISDKFVYKKIADSPVYVPVT